VQSINAASPVMKVVGYGEPSPGRCDTQILMRIASLQPSITITLATLNKLDTLCACTKYCLEALPTLEQQNLHILHDSWTANTDEILAAKPDLVIASIPYRMESLAAILKSGLPVLTLAPHSLADIYKDIRLIAAVVDAQPKAESLITEMQSAIASTRALSERRTQTPIVYCEEWGKPLIHSQSWVAELVEAAGGQYLGTPGAHTTAEDIAAEDPDVLLFSWCGAGNRVPLERVIAQRNWHSLKAVRQRRVFCIPDQFLNTPAHTLLEGLACIAAATHPALHPHHPELIQLPETQISAAGALSGRDPSPTSASSPE
jgi:iron complex transport system substrate-binding protein